MTSIDITKKRIQLAKKILVQLKRLENMELEYRSLGESVKRVNKRYQRILETPALDEREKEIVRLRQKGLTLREIAPLVGLTYGSLKHVSARISKKTNETDGLTWSWCKTNID